MSIRHLAVSSASASPGPGQSSVGRSMRTQSSEPSPPQPCDKHQFRRSVLVSETNCCLSLCLQVSCHCETSAHTGRGNPPVRGETYRKVPERMGVAAVFGGNRFLVPFNRGIATPVCALARNDSKFSTNTNLSVC